MPGPQYCESPEAPTLRAESLQGPSRAGTGGHTGASYFRAPWQKGSAINQMKKKKYVMKNKHSLVSILLLICEVQLASRRMYKFSP